MREIPLSKGMVAMVDEADYAALSSVKWHASKSRRDVETYYAERYVTENGGKRRKIYMHRLIMGNPLGDVDHKNGNGLDNRRENLRAVSHSVNMQNRKGAQRNSTTGIRNVQQVGPHRWQVMLEVEGERKYIGTYRSKIAAEEIAEDARRQYFRS